MTHCPGAVKRFRAVRLTCDRARALSLAVGDVSRQRPTTQYTNTLHLNLGDRTADQTANYASFHPQRRPSTFATTLTLVCRAASQLMPSTAWPLHNIAITDTVWCMA